MTSFGVSDSASTPSAARASGESSIDFAVRGNDAAACGDQRLVVVGPRRAGQLEEPLALGEARLRVRVGIEEDVPVVERADQLDVAREQHPVAEDVAGHVADPDDGEVGGVESVAELAEVPLDGLPRAAGGDAHRLVVVARRAARGEGVAEPEAVLLRDRVRDVGERRRALVGRDDEVRVVVVVADDVGRRHDLAAGDRVGDVEQAAHERAVALDDLREERLAVAACGGRLTTKPPLAPTGTMTAFLTVCAFISPRISVRKSSRRSDQRIPPRATLPPRRCTASTPRRVDEDLGERPRLGQVGDQVGVELQREVRLRLPVGVGLEVVRPHDRPDRRAGSCAGCGPRRGSRPRRSSSSISRSSARAFASVSRARSGSRRRRNSSTSLRAIAGCAASASSMYAWLKVLPDLAQVLGGRAQDHDLARRQLGREHEPVEAVVLGISAPGAREGVLEGLAHGVGLELRSLLVPEPEVVDPDGRVARAAGSRTAARR